MQLNFPQYPIRRRVHEKQPQLFDIVRKKWVAFTPEEWVRQHVLHWLVTDKGYPAGHIAVEKQIALHNTIKRCDILCHNMNLRPIVLVECKAPEVAITQDVFDQIARYDQATGVDYLLITNGLRHFCCRLNHEAANWTFLPVLPAYSELLAG